MNFTIFTILDGACKAIHTMQQQILTNYIARFILNSHKYFKHEKSAGKPTLLKFISLITHF